MNSFGIPFTNRTKTVGVDAECPAKKAAEFFAFASICKTNGVSEYVKGVEYSSNDCCFWIDVDDEHEFTEVGGAIDWAADRTLSQFVIFGRSEIRNGLGNS